MKEELTRRIIEATTSIKTEGKVGYSPAIGRVMAALNAELWGYYYATGEIWAGVITAENITTELKKICDWKIHKEDGSEATLEDQSEETLTSLLALLK